MSAALELARELIARASVTPGDAGCQRLIAERLAGAGFEAEWFHCGDVTNVLIARGTGAPSTWFLGHTDVVPPGPLDAWTSPPFEPTERGGLLYGRGACDMKGAVAAMVVALETFAADHPGHAGEIGVLLTSDEEGLAVDGIRRVAEILERQGRVPDRCLVGEPSSRETLGDTVRIGRRGSHVVTLKVRGIQGHTAFPETIDNPIHRLAPFLAELVETRWDEGVEDDEGSFGPTSLQVSNFRAGIGADNVTPPEAEVVISIRNNPNWTGEELRSAIESMLERNGVGNFEVDWRVSGEPFRSPAGRLREAVIGAVRETLGIDPELNTGGGTSDGRFIAPLGAEVVELGLINASIHQVNENTPIEDLDRLAHVYRRVLENLHANDPP